MDAVVDKSTTTLFQNSSHVFTNNQEVDKARYKLFYLCEGMTESTILS
jgi:hypothetical protein